MILSVQKLWWIDSATGLPKRRLDASDIIFTPVSLGHILLANWDSRPGDPHHGNTIDVILVEFNGLLGVVTSRPLVQAPGLDDLLGLFQLQVLARHITIKELPLSTLLRTFKFLWGRAGESSQSLRVGEGLVQLLGCRSELLGIRDRHGIDNAAIVALCGG
jgi:hypothetical protein